MRIVPAINLWMLAADVSQVLSCFHDIAHLDATIRIKMPIDADEIATARQPMFDHYDIAPRHRGWQRFLGPSDFFGFLLGWWRRTLADPYHSGADGEYRLIDLKPTQIGSDMDQVFPIHFVNDRQSIAAVRLIADPAVANDRKIARRVMKSRTNRRTTRIHTRPVDDVLVGK